MMAGVDRISALPEETKVSILSLLPITDAVRTSILSRSWRHLWTLLPGFHADLNSRRGQIRCPENVSRILSSLRGPVRHFSLEFSLSLSYLGAAWPQVQLPYFYSLKDLELSCIIISLPSDFCGFKQLTSLKLYRVVISQQDIQSLIDGSEKLTSINLYIRHYRLFPNDAANEQPLSVTFNCPLLRYLRLHFWGEDVQGRIVSAPCLESAHVTTSSARYIPRLENVIPIAAATLKFMADISHVSHLSLNFDLLMCLSRVDVPYTLRVHFQQLKCLNLIGDMRYTD
ncbi:hypothetical protein LUZ63_018874 [Rhynchospora breviuscula]|uniref:F-box domain-containing protein n=1 Tax=Rhynchospora breviuscula TaxID=2022672 RepID=A0A9Q0C5B9_9POAL|nr:hypothetical protein LUZ63_018874 [Rhynchospora breviuscula]